MAKRPALGKGMGALLSAATPASNGKYFLCGIEDLKPHHSQPRKTFNDEKMEELVASIKEKGVIQPLVVRRVDDFYQIIAGERRWRAAQKAGLTEVPVTIQDVSEDWALEIALIENIQREDLNAIEEAEAYKHLIENFDLAQDDVAKRVGKSRSAVTNSLRLLRLPEAIRQDVLEQKLSMGHARCLLSLESDEDMVEARDQVVKKGLSVRATESLVKKIKTVIAPSEKEKQVKIDPELNHLEDILKKNLGTQVKIKTKGKGGRIEISFYDNTELQRILDYMNVV
ncbi:ParB/RepB/Spo0J family partition protein [Desulfuromonas acetoxidans]|uniref:ParB-like partition proteins n=1 Tax=Desulfuromonas acetoxidans (strain DSM 684 / 11070) TaxID=281689 RepID=Q1JZG2_DESA6|nr:ParB/RepB/Spo0J family partition protein [Desulfuromonas acetoxidans]EAT15605.1 parB-like partition proteins [Desulfuromonas acetoxidans DSM 684]MBF0645768.1 ParB/RepB/Spo0J family partition protein [Desulfuromonas acetoxidans]NVD25198.1 ParB/RepB/Spo0J family partition protein [Desulfuromonas acetoxidans]NVE17180.1 ParB/RepB/Spo0J family partition protein [Desulfuromonas acetoxidans]